MFVTVFIAAAIACILTVGGTASPLDMRNALSVRLGGRIVGGVLINITLAPHQVSLQLNGQHICGGSILNESFIQTAAHCVSGLSPASAYSVKCGVSKLSEQGIVIGVNRIHKHPRFNPLTINNDVALLKLKTPLVFTPQVQPIAVAETTPNAGTLVQITGFGVTIEGGTQLSDELRMVIVPVVDHDLCSEKYQITDAMICAGVPEGGKDACQGDSGGPVVYDGKLVGSVSFGKGCARPGYPGVNANLAKFKQWTENCINFPLLCLLP